MWRSMTAIPMRNGFHYTIFKDMTAYSAILRTQSKVIMELVDVNNNPATSESMELANVNDSPLASRVNVMITALYYNDADLLGPCEDDGEEEEFCLTREPPHVILPISSKSSDHNRSSAFALPNDNASVKVRFPLNVKRAVVSVFATGLHDEEFWYKDVPRPFLKTYENSSFANGYGSWREVQVWIGRPDYLAGVIWPRPVVFPGGINPGLWVPVGGLSAFDVQSVDVDVSPWLGMLCNGNFFNFTLKVVSHDPTSESNLGSIAPNGTWLVSGRISLWLDEDGEYTTGEVSPCPQVGALYASIARWGGPQLLTPEKMLRTEADGPSFNVTPILTTYENGANNSLFLSLEAARNITHLSEITTSKGTRTVVWHQALDFTDMQNFTAAGRNLTLALLSEASSKSSLTDFDTDAVEDCTRFEDKEKWIECAIGNAMDYSTHAMLHFFQSHLQSLSNDTNPKSSLYAILDQFYERDGYSVLEHLTSLALLSELDEDHWEDLDLLYENELVRQRGSSTSAWNSTYYKDTRGDRPVNPADETVGETEQWYVGRRLDVLPPGRGKRRDMTYRVPYGRYVKAVNGETPRIVEDELNDHLDEEMNTPQLIKGDGINKLPIGDCLWCESVGGVGT